MPALARCWPSDSAACAVSTRPAAGYEKENLATDVLAVLRPPRGEGEAGAGRGLVGSASCLRPFGCLASTPARLRYGQGGYRRRLAPLVRRLDPSARPNFSAHRGGFVRVSSPRSRSRNILGRGFLHTSAARPTGRASGSTRAQLASAILRGRYAEQRYRARLVASPHLRPRSDRLRAPRRGDGGGARPRLPPFQRRPPGLPRSDRRPAPEQPHLRVRRGGEPRSCRSGAGVPTLRGQAGPFSRLDPRSARRSSPVGNPRLPARWRRLSPPSTAYGTVKQPLVP